MRLALPFSLLAATFLRSTSALPSSGLPGADSRVLQSSEYPLCNGLISGIGSGACFDDNNNEACGYDGGDCCSCDCFGSCNGPFDCKDPSSSCFGSISFTATPSAAPSPAPAFVPVDPDYPFCVGEISGIGSGFCYDDNNNEFCDYDGGDCCSCNCVGSCSGPFDCKDPSSSCFGEISTEPSSGPAGSGSGNDGAPVGAIVGGTIGGVAVVGAIVMAALYKTGRLKRKGRPSNDATAGGSAAAAATSTSAQYPVAGPASASVVAPPHGIAPTASAPSGASASAPSGGGQLPTALQYPVPA